MSSCLEAPAYSSVCRSLKALSTGSMIAPQYMRERRKSPSSRCMAILLTPNRKNGYAQDHFTLRSTYLRGRPPKSVNMYWRRFAMSSIPVDDKEAFEKWVIQVWQEKDDLLAYYQQHGTFPADEAAINDSSAASSPKLQSETAGPGYLETQVKLKEYIELGQLFVGPAALWTAYRVFQTVSRIYTESVLMFGKTSFLK